MAKRSPVSEKSVNTSTAEPLGTQGTPGNQCTERFLAQIDKINNHSKFGKNTIMNLESQGCYTPENVISFGILPMDLATGIGGVPYGKVVEIFGPEGGGKTTLSLYLIKSVLEKGENALFIDAEHALNTELVKGIGIPTNKFFAHQPDNGESALTLCSEMITSGTVNLIVIDSVAALTPRVIIENGMDKESMGVQARMMSKWLSQAVGMVAKMKCSVVFINQIRSNIQNMGYGPSETTPGGRALKFYSSMRIEVKKVKTLKTPADVIYGHNVVAKVVKNKMSAPFRCGEFPIIYGHGVPLENTVAQMGMSSGVLEKRGSWISYKGDVIAQGELKLVDYLMENKTILKEIENDIKQKLFNTNLPPTTTETENQNTENQNQEFDTEIEIDGLPLDETDLDELA